MLSGAGGEGLSWTSTYRLLNPNRKLGEIQGPTRLGARHGGCSHAMAGEILCVVLNFLLFFLGFHGSHDTKEP